MPSPAWIPVTFVFLLLAALATFALMAHLEVVDDEEIAFATDVASATAPQAPVETVDTADTAEPDDTLRSLNDAMTPVDLFNLSSHPQHFLAAAEASFFNDLVPGTRSGLTYTVENPDRRAVHGWGFVDSEDPALAANTVEFVTSENGLDWHVVDRFTHKHGDATDHSYRRTIRAVSPRYMGWRCADEPGPDAAGDHLFWELSVLNVFEATA